MIGILKALCICGIAPALFGCAGLAGSSCAPGTGRPVLVFDLFFGAAIPGRGDLTQREWLEFVDDTIAANLPDGFTVFDAAGGWRDPATHTTTREATKVLLAALPDSPASVEAIGRIRTAYQVRFRQQLVGMTAARACASF